MKKNNKKILGTYKKLWNEIKNQIETTNCGKRFKYIKDFMKICFYLDDDDLPLGKILSIPILSIVVKFVLQNEKKCYPQIHRRECEYECEYKL